MSQGGTKREQQRAARKELTEKLRALRVQPNDVLVVEVREDFFGEPERMQTAQVFANEVNQHTGRPVFVVKEGYVLTAVPDPRPPQPEPPPRIATPERGIFLPRGVRFGPDPGPVTREAREPTVES